MATAPPVEFILSCAKALAAGRRAQVTHAKVVSVCRLEVNIDEVCFTLEVIVRRSPPVILQRAACGVGQYRIGIDIPAASVNFL